MLRSLFQVAGEDWGQSLKWCLFLHVTFALREASDLWASSSCLLQCGFCDVLGLDCQTWVSTLKNCGLQACFLHVNFNWKIGCKSQVCKLTKWLQSWKCPSIWTVFYRLGSKLQYLIRFALPMLAVCQDKLVMTRHFDGRPSATPTGGIWDTHIYAPARQNGSGS